MKITGNEFSAYLAAKGASEKCPFCSHDVWSVATLDPNPNTDQGLPMEILVGNIPLFNGEPETGLTAANVSVMFTPLTCVTCGYMRLQNIHTILDWIKARGANE